ncbi:MAG: chemotaxis protein CheX [Planctomycetota bacterium]|jgi:chemotaxis protein CheX
MRPTPMVVESHSAHRTKHLDTILLVNDSSTLTKVLSAHFSQAGYRVIAVADVISAYQSFIRNDIDLILTDYILGNCEGLEIIETFRSKKANATLPIVVFTALEDEDTAARCMEAGADLVLAKSHGTDRLVSQIQKLIDECKAKKPSFSLDQDMGRCIVKATVDVFQTMMNLRLEAGEVSIEKAQMRQAEVIGSIGVAGFLTGSISVFLPRSIAAKAVASMLMMEPDELSDGDLVDAIGEVTNMVGGGIKTELFQKAPLFDIAVPCVYMGDDLQRRTVSNDLCFFAPFTLDGESFSVEFLMVTKKAGGTGVQASVVDSMQKS